MFLNFAKRILISLLFNLIILSCAYGKIYKGAEYRTKEAFTYGRFEAHYKPANREGVVSSFFTYHEITDSTSWNEIDIEVIGRYQNNIQFNVIDAQTLRKAQAEPEKNRDLIVRVAGYSDYFVDLDSDHQAEIISRTEQEMA